jgi:hypothetical protein
MPDLDFKVTGVEAAAHGLTPLLNFRLSITNRPEAEAIQSVMLRAQIQIASPQREYTALEKERLAELFGAPQRWGQTLRNRFWASATALIGPFTGGTEAELSVPCTYDLNVAAAKYFYALEEGEAPLLFLFSGTVFYPAPDGRLQAQQISWSKESAYRMPVQTWREMMDQHFPKSGWLYLDRDVFDRLYAFRRAQGLGSWDETIGRLLEKDEVPA